MSHPTVRPAQERDVPQIAAVHAASAQAAYEEVVPGARHLPMAERQAFWRDAIEFGEPLVHVAESDGRVIGFVGYDRSRDAGSKATTGELWALFVDPKHWSHGVGAALWEAARQGLTEEGCTEVTLWVPLCNQRALHFLESAGFERQPGSVKTASLGGVPVEEIRLRRTLA